MDVLKISVKLNYLPSHHIKMACSQSQSSCGLSLGTWHPCHLQSINNQCRTQIFSFPPHRPSWVTQSPLANAGWAQTSSELRKMFSAFIIAPTTGSPRAEPLIKALDGGVTQALQTQFITRQSIHWNRTNSVAKPLVDIRSCCARSVEIDWRLGVEEEAETEKLRNCYSLAFPSCLDTN